MSRPTLINLETALWVYRMGSFSGAARIMNATQPAVSLRIRELESALKLTLFTRHGQSMLPTERGREILDRMQPIIESSQTALEDVAQGSGIQQVLRIGVGYVGMNWLATTVRDLFAEVPRAQCEVSFGTMFSLVSTLEQDKLDVIFVPVRIDHPKFATQALGDMAMTWVTTSGRLRGMTGEDPADLQNLLNCGPIWLPPRTASSHTKQRNRLTQLGAKQDNMNICSDTAQMLAVLKTTGGWQGCRTCSSPTTWRRENW